MSCDTCNSKSITDEEVPECIREKIEEEGWDQDRAVAACLNMAREGSVDAEQIADATELSVEEAEKELKKAQKDSPKTDETEENKQFVNLKAKGKDVEIVNKESQDGDGEVVVNVPIQALTEDRDGDFINEKGQESIIRQLKSGQVPLFLNHGVGSSAAMYDGRDIIGQFIDGDNRNGTTVATARLRKTENAEGEKVLHRDAKEIVELLEQDMPLGFSVGFIPKDAEEKSDGEGMEISDLDLMEVSAVGIPSNPDAVPQAMGQAVAMAKNAGMDKDDIINSIRKGFEDTMSAKDNQESETDTNTEQDGSKSEKQSKQLSDEEVEMVLETIGGAMETAMDGAMAEIEEALRNGEEDSDEETNVTDEDEDEENEEEMSDEPEKDASDHNEESEKDSSESENKESEEEEEKGLDEEEKTEMKGDSDEPRKIKEIKDQDPEEDSKEKSEEEFDPFMPDGARV